MRELSFSHLGWAVTDRQSPTIGKTTSRKSQPLIGLGHVAGAPVGWDGRNASLEAQAKSSIATGSMSMRETPTPVKIDVIEERIGPFRNMWRSSCGTAQCAGQYRHDGESYRRLRANHRAGGGALRSLDQWRRGGDLRIGQARVRFVQRQSQLFCLSRHVAVTDDLFHDIGTSTKDLGRGRDLKNDELMKFAFKTPTLRSVALRPPYMHNGSSVTLYDVMKHYEKGGIDRPSRSPMMSAGAIGGTGTAQFDCLHANAHWHARGRECARTSRVGGGIGDQVNSQLQFSRQLVADPNLSQPPPMRRAARRPAATRRAISRFCAGGRAENVRPPRRRYY